MGFGDYLIIKIVIIQLPISERAYYNWISEFCICLKSKLLNRLILSNVGL
jgi:hypothetical protein